jgi:hypothetical protein
MILTSFRSLAQKLKVKLLASLLRNKRCKMKVLSEKNCSVGKRQFHEEKSVPRKVPTHPRSSLNF